MKESDRKFWPFKPKVSILLSIIILIVLLAVVGILRSTIGWPADGSTNAVLIGIFLLSIFPILLAILDVIIERGGTVGYGDFKIDFSKVQQTGTSGFTIPANIGVRGQQVNESGISDIFDALLMQATSSNTVVIDLEDGHAWWETRLLVLIAGAERLGKPNKIVFTATDEGRDQCFLGWCNPSDLLHCMLKENQQYLKSFLSARAIARQWEMLEPLELIPPYTYYQIPNPPPSWIQGNVAQNSGWIAFSSTTGLPNELLAEQLLQKDLGEKIEKLQGSKHVSIERLNELFRPVLIKQNIDLNWSEEQQKKGFLDNDTPWIAITQNGKYSSLVSRMAIINQVLKPILDKGIDK